MKNKNEKDRRLDSLFSDYMESGESPSVNVTFKAKEYIRKSMAKATVAERAAVTETGESAISTDGAFGHRRIAAYFGGFLAAIVILTAAILIGNGRGGVTPGDDFLQSVMSSEIASLEVKKSEYSSKEFMPFIDGASVSEYREYYEKENNNSGDDEGKTVAYYVEYTVDGVKTRLYVKESGVPDSSGAFPDHSAPSAEVGITHKISDGNSSCYGFSRGGYVYYFEFTTTDKKAVDEIVGKIKKSF